LRFLVGILAWTFIEYFLHRWVLHHWYTEDHLNSHHKRPEDYTVGPSWSVIGLIVAAVSLICYYTRLDGYLYGLLFAYSVYTVIHYLCHHQNKLNRWIKPLIRWHATHHAQDNVNYGVSSPLWDIIFRTFK
jgi:sterol desaturase/sphingolipid hydroxylase (fatty acid hydroxylase superfamily)